MGRGSARWLRRRSRSRFAVLFVLLVDAEQVRRGILLGQFDIEEDYDTRDVIDYAFFLTLPSEVALFDDGLGSLLRILSIVEGLHDLGDLVVRNELPHAVARNHDEFIILA